MVSLRALVAASVFAGAVTAAQTALALERNLPPLPAAAGAAITTDAAAPATGDKSSFGVRLRGITLYGLDDDAPGDGNIINIVGVRGIEKSELERAIAPYLGQELSLYLINEIKAAVAARYREAGKPLVSVATPPQEITSGKLQLQVVPFELGRVIAKDDDKTTISVLDRLQAKVGELVDTVSLADDIDWINRYPFRFISGIFEPGTKPGTTDFVVTAERKTPFTAYAGYSNSGNKASGYSRYFLGFTAGIEALNDLVISYQTTASNQFWNDFAETKWPDYMSHAARFAFSVGPRQIVEISPNYVNSRQLSVDRILEFRNKTFELPILYRTAARNLIQSGAVNGEFYFGTAFKWMQRTTAFDDIRLAAGRAAIANMVAGWAGVFKDGANGQVTYDMRIVANPGGIVPGNTDRHWSEYTNGRVTSSRYVYALAQIDRTMPLDNLFGSGSALVTSFTGLLAGQALPDSEQLSLGGMSAVRGYSSEEASVDTGFVLRNEIRLPAFSILGQSALGQSAGVSDAAVPYLFADLGWGMNYNQKVYLSPNLKAHSTLASVGIGLDYRLMQNIRADMLVGLALTDGRTTKAGDFRFQTRMSVSF